MSRPGATDVVAVKARDNVYTVLVIVGFLAQALAFLIIYMRFKVAFGGDLFAS